MFLNFFVDKTNYKDSRHYLNQDHLKIFQFFQKILKQYMKCVMLVEKF